jgi:hypothetical protein
MGYTPVPKEHLLDRLLVTRERDPGADLRRMITNAELDGQISHSTAIWLSARV